MAELHEDGEFDRGVSTIFGCLSVGLMIAVTGIGIRLGGAMVAREQAEAAADLGALAGAARILDGRAAACATAGALVAANRGSMTSCTDEGFDLIIEATSPVPGWGGSATAHARAGPVTTW